MTDSDAKRGERERERYGRVGGERLLMASSVSVIVHLTLQGMC